MVLPFFWSQNYAKSSNRDKKYTYIFLLKTTISNIFDIQDNREKGIICKYSFIVFLKNRLISTGKEKLPYKSICWIR